MKQTQTLPLLKTADPLEQVRSGWRRSLRPSAWRGRLPHAPVIGVAVLVSLAALLPLGFIVWITVQTGWQTASALVFRGRVGELLVNTVLLEACTIPLSVSSKGSVARPLCTSRVRPRRPLKAW